MNGRNFNRSENPPSVRAQLDDIRHLKFGWFDGEIGVPFYAKDLDWLVATWQYCQPDNVMLPYVYPTVLGEIQAEWFFEHYNIILRINLKEHLGRWHYMNMQQSENGDEERLLDLDNPEEWSWLFQRIYHFQCAEKS